MRRHLVHPDISAFARLIRQMHVNADLGPQIERAASGVGQGRDSVGVDGLANEPAQPPRMTTETTASVNAKTLAKVSFQLGETRDLVAVARTDVDRIDISLAEEVLGQLELRTGRYHEREPPRGIAAPLPESVSKAVILVVTG